MVVTKCVPPQPYRRAPRQRLALPPISQEEVGVDSTIKTWPTDRAQLQVAYVSQTGSVYSVFLANTFLLRAFATLGLSHTVRGHCPLTDHHPHTSSRPMTQDTHPFAWNSPLSHAPRPNQVRARRTRCRSLQHVHTTDLEDYATPGIYWWESPGETRWTVLLPSLPASVEGHCASQVATPRGLAAWHSLEPGRGRMNCQLVCAKLYFCPHNPVQGGRWPGGFTKCSVTISVVSKRFLGPSPVRLRRGRIPKCGKDKVSRILPWRHKVEILTWPITVCPIIP